jgi:hypothetical protein
MKLPTIPEQNSKKWNQYITTEYHIEVTKDPLVIDFKEFFTSDNEIGQIIEYLHSILISPAIFLDFKLFNNGEEVFYDMDWSDMILTTKEPVRTEVTNIIVYADLKYMNETLIEIKKLYEDRLK